MPFASSSTFHTLKSRAIPLTTAIVLSTSLHTAYTYYSPVLAEEAKPLLKSRLPASDINPLTPLGWGSNRYLTLSPESSTSVVKRPAPLAQLGATPLRDLVLAEKYGACVDAKGDLWFWGAGYDPSGRIGRSLKGKVSLCPKPRNANAADRRGHCNAHSRPGQACRARDQWQAVRRIGVKGHSGHQAVPLGAFMVEQDVRHRPRRRLCRAQSRGRSQEGREVY
jgi:hypothetical protein